MNEEDRLKRLKSVQNLNTVSFIAGPVSLLFGGVLLSLIALICAIVSFARIRRLRPAPGQDALADSLYGQSVVALVITAVAFALNGFFFATTFALLMDVMQTGDYSQFLDNLGFSGEGSGEGLQGSGSSVWDR